MDGSAGPPVLATVGAPPSTLVPSVSSPEDLGSAFLPYPSLPVFPGLEKQRSVAGGLGWGIQVSCCGAHRAAPAVLWQDAGFRQGAWSVWSSGLVAVFLQPCESPCPPLSCMALPTPQASSLAFSRGTLRLWAFSCRKTAREQGQKVQPECRTLLF